ncbi:MAG TPA: hypothetical protein VMT20_26025 [Terriglobia bacterium]|nr:hypothetical protein [Terriglobia bacterium]
MTFETDKKDLTDVLEFIEKLLQVLVERVPEPDARQFRRVWDGEIRGKIQSVKGALTNITSVQDDHWKELLDVGWTDESLRLKGDALASAAHKGALAKVLKLVNTALGSLEKVFPVLDPVKEFKEFLEPFFSYESEPAPYIQTLFPGGSFRPAPIPKADANS